MASPRGGKWMLRSRPIADSSQPIRPHLYHIAAFALLHILASASAGFATDFSDADLSGAHLTNVDLRGSNLRGANLVGTDLSRSDLRETNITQSQLDGACGSGTKLPPGLRIQPCLSRADSARSSLRTETDLAHQSLHGAGAQIFQDSQHPSDRKQVSSNSQATVSTGARRQ
jgi:Pentapeptide repeats (8 copies)